MKREGNNQSGRPSVPRGMSAFLQQCGQNPTSCRPVCGAVSAMSFDEDDSVIEERSRQQQQPGPGGTVRNFVDGILSPFMSCIQPPIQACVAPNCYDPRQRMPYVPTTRNGQPSGVVPAEFTAVATSIPTTIIAPNENDVLCGRGNNSNKHTGNKNFRDLVAANKSTYGDLTKKEKMLLAREIVDLVLLNTDPPGRFLCKDSNTGMWYDVGLPRSLEKTSQALREKSATERAAEKTSKQNDDDNSNCTATKARRSGPITPPPIVIPDHLKSVYGHSRKKKQTEQPVLPPRVDGYVPRHPPPIHSNHPHFRPTQQQGNYPYPPPPQQQPPIMPSQFPMTAPRSDITRMTTPDRYSISGKSRPYPSLVTPNQIDPGNTTTTTTKISRIQSTPENRAIAPPMFPTDDVFQNPDFNECRSSLSNISPLREQEWKRQRTSSETTHRVKNTAAGRKSTSTFDYNDSYYSESHLNTSLESQASSTGLTTDLAMKCNLNEKEKDADVIQSPSFITQSITRQRSTNNEKPIPKMSSTLDVSADSMDGLAALSAAAFLRLDESY